MSKYITIDTLFPSGAKTRDTGKIDIDSLFKGTSLNYNNKKNDVDVNSLLDSITNQRKKKLKSVINKRLFDSRGNSTSLLVSASHCQEGHSDTLFSLVEKTQSNKSQFNKSQSNKSKSGGKKRKTIKNPKKG